MKIRSAVPFFILLVIVGPPSLFAAGPPFFWDGCPSTVERLHVAEQLELGNISVAEPYFKKVKDCSMKMAAEANYKLGILTSSQAEAWLYFLEATKLDPGNENYQKALKSASKSYNNK
ncbi:hypothetical protein KKC45_01260 [Patescibacteria group bacterium]|nr:hypothetical protein [Patescibacteria group bacterium]